MNKLMKLMAGVLVTVFGNSISWAADSSEWLEINLETPGDLGVEILYKVDELYDVTHLRVSGIINSADWTTIGNLKCIQELDMKNAVTTSIPEAKFSGRSSLVSIVLPETLKTIGKNAFRQTSITELSIPANVISISEYAFYNSKVKSVIFEEGNRLNLIEQCIFEGCDSLQTVSFSKEAEISNIPFKAFYNCKKLSCVNLPDCITSIGNYAFSNTSSLTLMDFPENLRSIGSYAFHYSGLKRVIIPERVYYIGGWAFSNCENLQEIELPTCLNSMGDASVNDRIFWECNKIKKIVCKSPTPPSMGQYLSFSSKSNITLIVPDFAVPDYKLDSYWLGFGKIEGGAKSDFWNIAGLLSLSNERRMEGTPSVTLAKFGRLKVTGNAAMPMDEFKMNYDWSSSTHYVSQLINSSPLMSANKIQVEYIIPSESWRFISLPFDVNVETISHSDTTAEFVIRYYDGAERASANKIGGSWKNVPEGTLIKAGTGIIIRSNKEGTLSFPCADDGRNTIFNPNAVTMELADNVAESAAHTGWNFIANPFPCFYDMYYSMLSCPITVYDTSNSKYVAYSLIDDNVVLGPNRPFFIQSSDDVKEILFSPVGRQLSSSVERPSNIQARSRMAAPRALFNISLKGNGESDHTRIVLNPEATEEYELNRDASKFLSDNSDIPQIYTIAGDDYLAINERDEADGIVNVGFYAPVACEMVLSMDRIDGKASLYDSETGKSVILNVGEDYRFTVKAPGFDNNRFYLNLTSNISTGINALEEAETGSVVVEGNKIIVSNAEEHEIVIATIDGKVLVKEIVNSVNKEYSLSTGIYLVKVGTYAKKCYIK